MKLTRELVIKDPCQVSVDILRAGCRRFFRSHPELEARHLWFADHYEDFPRVKSDEVVDVVFFGSFVRRFLESGHWPEGRFRLWCLTSAVKTVMTDLLGIPGAAVGLIPRSELSTAPRKWRKLPRPTEKITFVFGGRLSATKNLELLVRTVHGLQTQHGLKATLVLSGKFDDRTHPDRGIWKDESYELHLSSVIDELEWKHRPVIKRDLGPRNWTKQAYINPVYVNLSTYLYEDFDVSLAQAQQAGWPAIISDWGGHRDVASGASVLKIHPAMIGHSHEIPELTKLRSRSLATWIATSLASRRLSSIDADIQNVVRPSVISTSEIDSIRRRFIERLGPGGLTLQRRGFEGYSYESGAERFFASYRAGFAAPYEGGGTAVLVNDLHASKNKTVSAIPLVCDHVLRDRRLKKSQIVFIPTNEVLQPMHSNVIHGASEILVPFESKHVAPLVDHWVRDLEIPARVFSVGAMAGKLSFKELGFERSKPEVGMDRALRESKKQDRQDKSRQ